MVKKFLSSDGAVGCLAGSVAFCLYFWSCAPNVTLLDSGEFAVAAIHFGVPHPTGYPLWTLLAWFFQLVFAFGNAMWRVNLFSAVCGGLAVGFCAALISASLRWLVQQPTAISRISPIGFMGETAADAGEAPHLQRLFSFHFPLSGFRFCLALSFSLLLACSLSMWSQAVIAEVYTLHALLVALFLWLLLAWTRHPQCDALMLGVFLVMALGFSNHQLFLALAPLPFLFILLLRTQDILDWLWAGLVTAGLVYVGFALLSNDEKILRTAIRFIYCLGGVSIVFLLWRRLRVKWGLFFFLPLVVVAGLLPHIYMPLASSTNPPMNWGYTSDTAGFYYSFNRSQYSGPLSEQSLRALGPITGISHEAEKKPFEKKLSDRAVMWSGFFWVVLLKDFSVLAIVGYFASLLLILRSPLPQRVWIYGLHIAFALAAFLQPILDGADIDVNGWWLQMPYHTYTNLIFAVLAAIGLGLLLARLIARWRVLRWLVPLLLVLPIFPFLANEPVANQRDRWFGWDFGHDMLKNLPQGAVMVGGTDPGRFVPTYMIFGESPQAANLKRDPTFDRRDLYILTQNALGEKYYMSYIRDQYAQERKSADTTFEHWLGRDTIYPTEPLILPTEKENEEIIRRATAPDFVKAHLGEASSVESLVFSEVLRWIWERNRDKHDFFVEESFSIVWTYDYAIPHGLIYRISPEKIETLAPEIIKTDFAYWAAYKKKLLDNPRFAKDLDARRSFAKLRIGTANIYRHRKLMPEAEAAYKEALEIYPASAEALLSLMEILWKDLRFDEADKYLLAAYSDDPHSFPIISLAQGTQLRRKTHTQIADCEATLRTNPLDRAALDQILNIYILFLADTKPATEIIQRTLDTIDKPPQLSAGEDATPTTSVLLRLLAQRAAQIPNYALTARAYRGLLKLDPDDATTHYFLARTLLLDGQPRSAAEPSISRAIELGGRRIREMMQTDPAFRTEKQTIEML